MVAGVTITTPKPNTYAVQCDRCGTTHELTARTADGGIVALGWRVIGHRQHACPECVEKEA